MQCVRDDSLYLEGDDLAEMTSQSLVFTILHCLDDPTKDPSECPSHSNIKEYWEEMDLDG